MNHQNLTDSVYTHSPLAKVAVGGRKKSGRAKRRAIVDVVVAAFALLECWVVFGASEYKNGYTWYYVVNDGEAEILNEKDINACAVRPEPTGSLTIPSKLRLRA